jgi:transposase
LLDVLGRMEVWLAHHGRAGLTPEARALLAPRFEKLSRDAASGGELARILKAPRSKVSEWLQRYQTDGVDGLLEGYRSGRPSELTQQQQQQLGDILDSGPVA